MKKFYGYISYVTQSHNACSEGVKNLDLIQINELVNKLIKDNCYGITIYLI